MPLSFAPDNDEGAYFFLLAKARKASTSLIIWLNGGPACSSMVGAMNENGPFTPNFRQDGEPGFDLTRNLFSWNEAAHVLFLEQPIRTGFSLAAQGARTIRNENEIAQDFYAFMISFLTVFDDMQNFQVFITGESYAGMYVPYMAQYVLKHQAKSSLLGEIKIDLRGVAIGNGAIDPLQDLSYAEYAYSHGLIPLAAKEYIDEYAQKCYQDTLNVKKKSSGKKTSCDTLAMVLEAAGQPNEYDTGTFQGYTRIIQPGGAFDRFFNDPEIQTALHVRGVNIPGLNFVPETQAPSTTEEPNPSTNFYAPDKWVVCNDASTDSISSGDFTSSVPALKYLSEQVGFRVLLYSGERDLNTNFLGTLHVLESLTWMGQKWSSADRSLWKFNGEVAGEYNTLENGKFSFLIVRNSGHLLPMDIPAPALDMLDRFVNDKSFSDVALPSDDSYRKRKEKQTKDKNNDLLSATQPASPNVATVTAVAGFVSLLATLVTFVVLKSWPKNEARE